MPLFGPPNIKNLEARKDVKGLIQALGYKKDDFSGQSQRVREDAAESLGRIGDNSASEALITMISLALQVNEPGECNVAINALGSIRDSRAFEFLLGLLKYDHLRASVAEALGKFKDARAIEPLLDKLGGLDDKVVKAVREALAQIGTPSVKPLIASFQNSYIKSVYHYKDHIWVLGEIGDPSAVEPLIALYIRFRAEPTGFIPEALGKIGAKVGAPVIDRLLSILHGEKPELQAMAVEALGAIKDVRAIEPMVAMLRDPEPMRHVAAEALTKQGWKPGSDADGARYWAELCEWQKCVAIGSAAVEPLLTVVSTMGWRDVEKTTKAAAEALDAMGWKPGMDEDAAFYWIAKHEWDQCVAIGAPAVEPLLEVLEKVGDVKFSVCHTLGKIGDRRAVMPLIAHLYKTRSSQAVYALGSLGDIRAIEPLQDALRNAVEDGSEGAGFEREHIQEALDKLEKARIEVMNSAAAEDAEGTKQDPEQTQLF